MEKAKQETRCPAICRRPRPTSAAQAKGGRSLRASQLQRAKLAAGANPFSPAARAKAARTNVGHATGGYTGEARLRKRVKKRLGQCQPLLPFYLASRLDDQTRSARRCPALELHRAGEVGGGWLVVVAN